VVRGLAERLGRDWTSGGGCLVAYGLVVLLGAVLLVVTALNQPYNQNEWVQLQPYASPDLGVAVSGTRQPPLDPLLGVAVQRLFGEGHLQQRLVPIACGIGALLAMAVLLRRLRLGWAGPLALLFMALAPLFLRYSAYARPYALPLLLMVVCAVAGTLWIDDGRRRWLVVAAVTALLLPLARVPEPSVFLAVGAAVLAVAGWRRRLPRGRAWPLAGALAVGLATVGVGMLVSLLAQRETRGGARSLVDLDPARALARVPAGATEIWQHVVPQYQGWFPWWPLTLAVVVLGLALPGARRRLLSAWYWWPLVLAPLAFLVVFHTMVPLDLRDYRIRFAYFAIPPLTMLVGVVAAQAVGGAAAGWRRALGAAVVAALIVSQVPTAWTVLTEDDAIDLAGAGRMISDRVPDDAVVVFDGPGQTGRWRQTFFGEERFVTSGTPVLKVSELARLPVTTPADAPVWLLLVDAECVSSVSCDLEPAPWDGRVEGYRPVGRLPHLTLYAPTEGQRGPQGLATAMDSLAAAYGPGRNLPNAVAGARILLARNRAGEAAALLADVCRAHEEDRRSQCRRELRHRGLGPLMRRARGSA